MRTKRKMILMSCVMALMMLFSAFAPMNVLARGDITDAAPSSEAPGQPEEGSPGDVQDGTGEGGPEETPAGPGEEESKEEEPVDAGKAASAGAPMMPYGKPSSLDADVTVDGIAEGGTIDGSTGIRITVTFPVPVIGDGADDYFQRGDEVELLLSESFKFDPIPASEINLMYGSKKVGTVTLDNNASGQAVAIIKFDGDEDIFDPDKITDGKPPYANVSGTFTADLEYNGHHITDGDGNKTVAILEKTYKLQLPGDTIIYDVEKKAEGGAVNLDEGTITWTVIISAATDTQPDPTSIDLEGYVFEDELKDVGEYVDDSFSPSGGTLVTPDSDASPPTTKLIYTFPAGSTSPQTITFKTKIPESVLTAGGNISNRANLKLDDETVQFDDATVTVEKPSVGKRGVATEPGSDTAYDPTNRTITWYVDVDNKSRSLKDLTITDNLAAGLTLESAQWQRWDSSDPYTADSAKVDGNWVNVSGAAWTGPTPPTGGNYEIGSKIGDVNYIGRLKLVAKVDDDDATVATKTYHNQATVSWSGSGGTTGGATTGNPGVGIGYDALTKSGTQDTADVDAHQITWAVNVDLKNQDATGFKVYDLFVHDKNTPNGDITGAVGWPSGLSIGSNSIARNNGQKFVEFVDDDTDDHLTVNAIPLQKDGQTIATLLEITGLRNAGSNKVVFKSQVLDPDIIAGNNQSQRVYNYAELYKGTIYRSQAAGSVAYNNKILAKELLRRAEVDNAHATGVTGIDANDRTINVAEGFHYGHKEVIFRLNVNAAGVDFKDVETNLSGGFGTVTVTDTLPAGWEFAEFSSGQDYLVYNTTGALSTGSGYPATGSLTATGSPLASVPGLTAAFATTGDPHTATFTFTDLNQPYVILVKARPTGDTLDDYLKGDDTRNETNKLNLSSANWQPGKDVQQQVRIDSKVLDKTLDLSKQTQGILTWVVNYTPLGQEIGTGLEDTLPEGIDLRTDSSGQLVWEEGGSRNINVRELTLKSDGSGQYEPGPELSLTELMSRVGYNNSTRKLTFTFPDKAKAYQLIYVTDITGTPGNVSNAVKLIDADGTGTSRNESFMIRAQHGEATMGRSGFLVMKKTNMGSASLQDAGFTLYNTNTDGTIGSPRAVRITGTDGIIKFYGLVPGSYFLVETQAPDGYENPPVVYNVIVGTDLVTTVNGSPSITIDNPFIVVNYQSTDPVGSLTIHKTVTGNAGDPAKAFDFTVTMLTPGGDVDSTEYSYTGVGVPGGTIKSGDIIALAHDQSITISGLPTGTSYLVEEESYIQDGYTTTSTGASGVISTGDTLAAFTNTKDSGSLAIHKTVTGNAGDSTKAFDFTVTLLAPGGDVDSTEYSYTGVGVPGGTIKSGDIIALAHDQSITISGLPTGTSYLVEEESYIQDGYTTTSTGASGVISTDGRLTAAFTNTKDSDPPADSGSLIIRKIVSGTSGDRERQFTFAVTFNASGSYGYSGSKSGMISSGQKVLLGHGEYIKISGLPVGTTYEVIEEEANRGGYYTTSTGATGTISRDGDQTAEFTNTRGGSPKTGDDASNGNAVFGVIAFSLLLAGVLGLVFYLRRKNRKRKQS